MNTETLTIREPGSPVKLELLDNADSALLTLAVRTDTFTGEMEIRLDPAQMAAVQEWIGAVRCRRDI